MAFTRQRIQVNITDHKGRPLPELEVRAISLARAGQIDELEATQTTDSSGTAYFNLDEPCFFRPMVSEIFKRKLRIQILGIGSGALMKHYVVDAEGFGTHTTVQSALDAVIAAGSGQYVIYINPGVYEENVSGVLVDGQQIFFVAEGTIRDWRGAEYNSVVRINAPVGSGTVMFFDGFGRVQMYGIEVNGSVGPALKFGTGVTDSLDFSAANCKFTSSLGDPLFEGATGALEAIDFRDCIFICSNGRVFSDLQINMTLNHVRCAAAGLIRGNYGPLQIFDCKFSGSPDAGEYYIEETGLIVSLQLYIRDSEFAVGGAAGGIIKHGALGAFSKDCIVTGNRFDCDADNMIGLLLTGIRPGAVVTGNYFGGQGNTDGGTAIRVRPTTGSHSCQGVIVMGNSIVHIENGLVVDANASDSSCVFGPNAYNYVGTNTSGVPAGEDYQNANLAGGTGYDPAVVADWDGGVDPGNVDDALDQLAERVTDIEDGATLDGRYVNVTGDTMTGNLILNGVELAVHKLNDASIRGLFRYIAPSHIELSADGDNISIRVRTRDAQTAGVVPGAAEWIAGDGNNSQGGAITIESGDGVDAGAVARAGGIIDITAGDAANAGVGGIINLTTGRSPSGTDGVVSVRLKSGGISDISPEFRIQQDQDGLGGDWQSIFTFIQAGMMSTIAGLSLGNMLDLQNEGDDAKEYGAVGGQYTDWSATAYDNVTHDSRNVTYLISPRDKAFYLWNVHTHGAAEEFFKLFWTGNVLKLITDKSGTGTLRDMTLDAGNGAAAALNLFGHNITIRARDTANGIFLDLPEAAGASFVKVRDSAFAQVFKVDSNGNVVIAGDLDIDGTLEVGTVQTYTITNVTTDRAYNADSVTLDELADVVGSLIADLRTIGLVN